MEFLLALLGLPLMLAGGSGGGDASDDPEPRETAEDRASRTINGTSGRDNLAGDDGDDRIWGFGGPDRLQGLGGNDTLGGGKGRDTLLGGEGDDNVFGGALGDLLFGGAGDDTLTGGAGFDRIVAGDGDDVVRLFADSGEDRIFLGAGNDVMEVAPDTQGKIRANGGAGDDLMVGGAGRDTLSGGTGNDYLIGGNGDRLFGEEGDDRIEIGFGFGAGGAGDDTLFGAVGAATLQGGTGNDTLILSPGGGSASGGEGDDFFRSQYAFELTGNDDLVEGTALGTQRIDAGAGNDVVDLSIALDRSGEATVDLGLGNDSFTDTRHEAEPTATSPDPASAGTDDVVRGGGGNDTIDAGHGADSVDGGAGDDLIDTRDVTRDLSRRGDAFEMADTVQGGGGNDTLAGDNGDTLTGGDGADLFRLDYLDRVQDGTELVRWDFDATVITDFTAADRIEITIEGAPDDVTLDLVASGTDTILRFGTHDVAVLKGVAPSAIADSQIVVTGP